MGLKGKRLLITGGTNFADDIRNYAQRNGIILIAAGNIPDTPLKRIADEQYDVDTTDLPAMLKLSEKTRIDGIFAGGSEPNIITAIRLTERLGLPYYCDMAQSNALMNKANFKALCRRFEIPITREYNIRSVSDLSNPDIQVDYPIVVKPVDSCGSKGVAFCLSRWELEKAMEDAVRFSESGRVIVEEYTEGDEISAVYTICNGDITLSCIKEKHPVAEQTGLRNMPSVYFYPSRHLERYIQEINDKVIRMLKSLRLRYGALFLQAFVNPEGIYMFEAGFRPGGTNDFRYTDRMNGVNHIHMLIEQALTGKVDDNPNSRDNPRFKSVCCSFTMCAKGGKVGEIIGLDQINDSHIETVEQFYHKGDVIPYGTTLAQRMLRFFIMGESPGTVASVIDSIQNKIRVNDENGESILYGRFDTSRLL